MEENWKRYHFSPFSRNVSKLLCWARYVTYTMGDGRKLLLRNISKVVLV
jgi:hypothetical protein